MRFEVGLLHVLIIFRLDDFSFQNILWVFSGRRGVHCWVADKRARLLSPASRKAIVSYLDIVKVSNAIPRSVLIFQDFKRKNMYTEMSIPMEYLSSFRYFEHCN